MSTAAPRSMVLRLTLRADAYPELFADLRAIDSRVRRDRVLMLASMGLVAGAAKFNTAAPPVPSHDSQTVVPTDIFHPGVYNAAPEVQHERMASPTEKPSDPGLSLAMELLRSGQLTP